MPKLSNKLPSYRLHKPSGRAVVTIAGKTIYLGKFGTPESREEYDRVLAEWLTRTRCRTLPIGLGNSLTLTELMVVYWKHVQSYYVKDGRPTSEQDTIRQALRPVRKLYGTTPVVEFGPTALKTVRQAMIEQGWCRSYINKQVIRVRRMFAWGVENELVPVAVHQALATVAGLAKNRSEAREKPPVGPVPDEHVDAVLSRVNSVVAAMIRVQRLTGMRPQEVVLLRPIDVDRSDPACWTYRPHRHKTEHHDRERVIYIGPKTQAILAPWLDRDPDAYCFRPSDAVAARNARCRARRKTPHRGWELKRGPKTNPKRVPGSRYTKDSYRVAIQRVCREVGIPLWSPNQLRHSQATEIRKRFGVEGAQAVLGHSELGVTQVYAERDASRAREIMTQVG
jgi:integrase